MQTIVTVSGVSFEFSNGHQLFKNISFTLEQSITALVGPNGVGKTSLAKLLTGELEPKAGSIRKSTSITFFRQIESPPSQTVREYLQDDYAWSHFKEKLLESIDWGDHCQHLSGGQWMRVRLARLPSESFLILDEPTNDLDRCGRNALIGFLQQHQSGLLLISHDRECLSLCDSILELSNQGLTRYGVSWSDYKVEKHQENSRLQNNLKVAKLERSLEQVKRVEMISRQDKRNRRGAEAAARGGMPKILIGGRKRRAQASTGKINIETLQRAQAAVQNAHQALSEIKFNPVMYTKILETTLPSQRLIAQAQSFNIKRNHWIYKKDLNFEWRGPIRLALKGANGSGKSSLLKAITGEQLVSRGELRRANIKSVYIDQQCRLLNEDKSVFENLCDSFSGCESDLRNGLAKFLFNKERVFQTVSELSGGERLRAALAKSLLSLEKPELIILDEPTNNLDLQNIEFLENLIREFKGALIIVSHDEAFLKNCEINSTFWVDDMT